MEKQLAFFEVNKPDISFIWDHLPQKSRQKIENTFTILLIKHIRSSIAEKHEHEK